MDSTQGLQMCDANTGTYCCQRDFDCCLNSTLTFVLGPPKVIRTIVRPTHLPDPAREDSDGAGMTKNTIVGIAVGFSIAAVLFIIGWGLWIWRRKRQARRLLPAKPRGNAKELDATETTSSSLHMLPKNTEVTQIEVVELESPITNTRNELDSIMVVSPIQPRSHDGTFGSGSSSMFPGTEMDQLALS